MITFCGGKSEAVEVSHFSEKNEFQKSFRFYCFLFPEGDFFNAFWAWHDLASFIIALLLFTIFWSLATWIFFNQKIYIEAIGMCALLTEATLGVPQLLRNFQRKSTQGMSIPMVLAWLAGDLAKTGYFVATGSPLQFWICAILQISIDIFILGQVFVYRKNTAAGELPYTANNQTTTSDSSEGAIID
ncbi:hypothetical protein CRE_21636 [Caenorhabditis remanei]|uniref:Uncharacterized protein n=1 Tax=Caenorhabditis remanei TaxID=31234 RepID=E3NQ69_CAERE|nr:hypothetical protein CRE_21636 [Caenorhabditis remanei]